jgi:hypothetical protein
MLQNIKDIFGSELVAIDAHIGHVRDFYFDDKAWVVRYLVADTGVWLPGQQVLIAPHAFAKFDEYERVLHVKLGKQQIQDCPPIEAHKPVSRQYEQEYFSHYGWPGYWNGGELWGLGGYPAVVPPEQLPARSPSKGDPHLRSSRAVIGYSVESVDGAIGHVSGFMVDDKSWAVRDIAVDTGHWYSSKEILISPSRVLRISVEESKVFVSLTKADILVTPDHELARAGTGVRK